MSYAEDRIAEIMAGQAKRFAAPLPPPEKPKKPTPERGFVYFLRTGNTVKIGFTTNPKGRLKNIKTACPEPPRIVKILKGGVKLERATHERFAEYRMHGEWFDLRGRLAKYLERCIYQIELPDPEPEPEPEGYL